MDKQVILSVLVKHLKLAVPDLANANIDPKASMTEIGANSLDVVDVVSSTMRELKVKIPRDQLSNLKSVGELVDALHAAQPKG
jgi:acyl carrier protein